MVRRSRVSNIDSPDQNNSTGSHFPKMRRVCSSCSSSSMFLSERRTSSANGACGRQDRHDSAGMRLLIADHGWRSKVRRSTVWVVRQAGQHTQRNRCRALSAQPIVGENSIGMRWACRSFHADTGRPASSSTCASVVRRTAASFSAACWRRSSILRRLKSHAGSLPNGKRRLRRIANAVASGSWTGLIRIS